MSARIKLVAALAAMVAVAAPTVSEAQGSSAAVTVDVNRQDAPGSYGNFIAALNNQAMHRARLARISNLTAAEVTVSDVSTVDAPDNTTAMDNAISRRASATRSTRTALGNNSIVAGVLSSAGIDMSRVIAIRVAGHELRDVTVYYR
jgi:hypothetical protein